AAIEVYYRQWVFLIASFGFALVVGGAEMNTRLPVLFNSEPLIPWYYLFLIVLISLVIALPWIMYGVVTPALYQEARGVITRCFLRDVPADTPIDLCDAWRHNWLTNGSRPLSSEITEADARTMETQSRAAWWVASILAVALAATTLVHFPFAAFPILILIIIKIIFDVNPAKARLG